jgi:hypothetical protein
MKTKKRRRRGGGRVGDFLSWVRTKVRGNYDDHKWDNKKTKKKKKYSSNEPLGKDMFYNEKTRSRTPSPIFFSNPLTIPPSKKKETGFYKKNPRKVLTKREQDQDYIISMEAETGTGFFKKSKEEKEMENKQRREKVQKEAEKMNDGYNKMNNGLNNIGTSVNSYSPPSNLSLSGGRRRKRNRRKRRTVRRIRKRSKRRSRRRRPSRRRRRRSRNR